MKKRLWHRWACVELSIADGIYRVISWHVIKGRAVLAGGQLVHYYRHNRTVSEAFDWCTLSADEVSQLMRRNLVKTENSS